MDIKVKRNQEREIAKDGEIILPRIWGQKVIMVEHFF